MKPSILNLGNRKFKFFVESFRNLVGFDGKGRNDKRDKRTDRKIKGRAKRTNKSSKLKSLQNYKTDSVRQKYYKIDNLISMLSSTELKSREISSFIMHRNIPKSNNADNCLAETELLKSEIPLINHNTNNQNSANTAMHMPILPAAVQSVQSTPNIPNPNLLSTIILSDPHQQILLLKNKQNYGQNWLLWDNNFTKLNFNQSPRLTKDEKKLADQSFVNKLSKKYDNRVCELCKNINYNSEQIEEYTGRLIMSDKDTYVHVNCCKWSTNIKQRMSVDSMERTYLEFENYKKVREDSLKTICCKCQNYGASLKCFRPKCNKWYHFPCALKCNNLFFCDNSISCPEHAPTGDDLVEQDLVRQFDMYLCCYIKRDLNQQIASVLSNGEMINEDFNQVENRYIIKLGSFLLGNIGKVVPEFMWESTSKTAIFPVGYESMVVVRVKSLVGESATAPINLPNLANLAKLQVKSLNMNTCMTGITGSGNPILPATNLGTTSKTYKVERRFIHFQVKKTHFTFDNKKFETMNQIYDYFKVLTGKVNYTNEGINAFLGLGHHAGTCLNEIYESLPYLNHPAIANKYKIVVGKNNFYDLRLECTISGCSRSEPWSKKLIKQNPRQKEEQDQEQRTKTNQANEAMSLQNMLRESGLVSQAEIAISLGLENVSDMSNMNLNLMNWGQIGANCKSTNKYELYRKMKSEWRKNSQLNRSRIQGLGLYAKRDLEAGTFIIEYTGELIRKDMAESRELAYDKVGKGTYMFRLSDKYIIDATDIGGAARYINHNCEPNCVAETVEIKGENHIIIVANRPIFTGEELCYDYMFDVEDDGSTDRVACMCGADRCRKWMN